MTILTYLTSLSINTWNTTSPEASEIFLWHRSYCLLVCCMHPSVLCSWSHLIIFLQLFIAILWEHQPERGDLFSTDAKPINVSQPTASIFPFSEHRFSLNDKKFCILISAFSFIGEKRMRPDLRQLSPEFCHEGGVWLRPKSYCSKRRLQAAFTA